MTDYEQVVEFALSQVGTAENPLGSNKQKYGALLDNINWYLYKDNTHTWVHKVNGFDWCTQTVDATFIEKFGIDKARKMLFRPVYNNYGAVVKYAFNYFKSAGRGYTKEEYNPKIGDVIYFQNSKGLSHTGIVVAVDDSTVTTVEGNSGKNNWYVVKKTYKKTDSYIYGYGHPDYQEEPKPQPTPETMDFSDLKQLYYRKGNVFTGTAVRVVQSVVIPAEIDGSFGQRTENAVKEFQKKEGITVDGIVGAETWGRVWRCCE